MHKVVFTVLTYNNQRFQLVWKSMEIKLKEKYFLQTSLITKHSIYYYCNFLFLPLKSFQ